MVFLAAAVVEGGIIAYIEHIVRFPLELDATLDQSGTDALGREVILIHPFHDRL